MYLLGKHLNLTTLVFVLHHLCHYPRIATVPSLIQTSLRHRWVPSHIPCQTDPKFFGNRISSIAFVPVKHQTVVWVSIYCCLWARTGQDYLAVPLRMLKESQLEMFSKVVSSEQAEIPEEQEKHKNPNRVQ